MTKKGNTYIFILSLLLLLIIFFFIFHHSKVSLADYSKFLLGLLVVVYVPGQSILWLLKLKAGKIETATLALVLGMTSSTLIYRISGIVNLPIIFFLWLAVLLVFFAIRLIKKPLKKEDLQFLITRTGITFLGISLLALTVLSIDNYRNGMVLPDSSVEINMHYYDGFIRNSVVRELSHSIPPQMPFAAGIPLSYHYDMDLFISMFYKHLRIGVLDLLHRLSITFYFLLLLMSVFIFVRLLSGSQKTSLLAVFLVLFGSGGFGYVGGILSKYPGWWGKIFYSFYFLDMVSINSFLPSVSILCAGFFCFLSYLKKRKISWLIMTGFFFAVITGYKMTYAVLLLGALFLSSIVYYIRYRDLTAARVFALTGIMVSPLLLLAYFYNTGGPQFSPVLRFNNWVIFALKDLNLDLLAKPWAELTLNSRITASNVLLFFPVLVGFFLGSFGLSFLALPGMFKDFILSRRENLFRFFLIAFFFTGIGIFFGINIVMGGLSRNWVSIYIYYLSVIVLIIFWSEKLMLFSHKKKKTMAAGLIVMVILLSIPNTVQFMWAKVHYPYKTRFDSSFMELCQWLNENSQQEAVILHSLKIQHVCYFTDRRVVLDYSPHSYLTFHLTPVQIQERKNDVDRFFSNPIINGDILTKYNISYVLVLKNHDFVNVDKKEGTRLDCFSRIGGVKIKKYQRTHQLRLDFQNKQYSIYRVNTLAYSDRDVFVLLREGPSWKLKKFSDVYRNVDND